MKLLPRGVERGQRKMIFIIGVIFVYLFSLFILDEDNFKSIMLCIVYAILYAVFSINS